MKLYAKQRGHGGDVITLHGLFGSHENLGVINRSLASSLRVHGLDLRNHGRSPHDGVMNYQAMAEDVLAYMDEQGIASAHLVGHSMGGKVAMTLALMAPHRVNRLAVIDIAPVTYHERRHDAILQGLTAIDPGRLAGRNEADRLLSAFEPEQTIRQFLLKNLYRLKQGGFGWRVNLDAIINNYQAILSGQQADRPFAGATLFIKGGASDYLLPEHRESVLALFPAATVRVIPAAGHWVHAQKPDLVSGTLKRFFAG